MTPSARDRKRLVGIHPALVQVIEGAFLRFDESFKDAPSFVLFVIEGLRTLERQKEMVAIGASQTLNSRHLTGHAVDLGISSGNAMRWEFPLYRRLWRDCLLPESRALGVQVDWGGEWASLRDGPHFELNRQVYNI